jgi:hypothetical protein
VSTFPRRRLDVARAALWLAAFALYAATTARGVLPADAGEFQYGAATWGILHPPGYPLYTVAGALWMRLVPLYDAPTRLNLLSALLAATVLLLLFEAVRTWAEAWGARRGPAAMGGLSAALLLGAAPTFWVQATTANIRMLTLLFGAWAFLALARFRAADGDEGDEARALASLALATGLGVGHHPSLVFVALGWVLYLLLLRPRLPLEPRRWWRPALVTTLAWALPQLYLPLRGSAADVPLDPGGLDSWKGFWDHVLARGFAGDMFAFANRADLAQRLPLLAPLFRLQFPLALLGATTAAWAWLAGKRTRLALALLLSWGVHTFVTLTYRAPQTVEYLMPAYLPVALALGLGAAALADREDRPARATALLLLAALLARPALHLPDFAVLSHTSSVRERVAPLLREAPPGALVLADWRWATPLWTLQAVEGLGQGVEVEYVYPVPGMEYEAVWRERAEAATAEARPLLTTHAYPWDEWTAAPVGGGYRLFHRPLERLPTELGYRPLDADLGPVRVLGYRVVGQPQPGNLVEVQLAWRATAPQEPPPSFTVRLHDPAGGLLTASDLFLGSDATGGEVHFDQLTLRLPLDRCPGSVTPTVGVYTVEDGAFRDLGEAALPPQEVACDLPSLPVERVHPGVVAPWGPVLLGVDYDVRGDDATAYLHWCGPGRGLALRNGDAVTWVEALAPGECQTALLPATAGQRPAIEVRRPDGAPARLVALPLPTPQAGQTYAPLADAMVLTGVAGEWAGEAYVVKLWWRSARPLVEDYAVSARLRAEDGTTLGVHDMQPALGAVPTLKWAVGGMTILDPHPFVAPEVAPAAVEVTVYERFRLTSLPGPDGVVTRVPLQ